MNQETLHKTYDVAIVGAGPAGAACALALRNSGLTVALIEKDTFPRDKTCGDAIPGPTLKFLKELLPESEREFAAFAFKQSLTSSIVYGTNGKPLEVHWKTKAYNSKRVAFDHFLLHLVKKYTHTAIYEGVPIKELIQNPQHLTIKTRDNDFTLQCKMVVGCDGANSVVARMLNHNQAPLAKGVALRAYYQHVEAPPHANEFYLLKDIKGYFWIFPLPDHQYNVGIGVLNPNPNKAFDLKAYLEHVIQHHPVISPKFKQASRQSKVVGFKLPFGGKPIRISGERFLLAGDAAHLVDPMLGHGIDKAIKSGMLAAQHLETCFKTATFSSAFHAAYDSQVAASIGKELTRNYRLMKTLTRFPWLLNLLLKLARLKLDTFLNFYYRRKKAIH